MLTFNAGTYTADIQSDRSHGWTPLQYTLSYLWLLLFVPVFAFFSFLLWFELNISYSNMSLSLAYSYASSFVFTLEFDNTHLELIYAHANSVRLYG